MILPSEEKAGPSTSLRSGRDDKSSKKPTPLSYYDKGACMERSELSN